MFSGRVGTCRACGRHDVSVYHRALEEMKEKHGTNTVSSQSRYRRAMCRVSRQTGCQTGCQTASEWPSPIGIGGSGRCVEWARHRWRAMMCRQAELFGSPRCCYPQRRLSTPTPVRLPMRPCVPCTPWSLEGVCCVLTGLTGRHGPSRHPPPSPPPGCRTTACCSPSARCTGGGVRTRVCASSRIPLGDIWMHVNQP